MNALATLPYREVESSLGAVLSKLDGHADKTLAIVYGDREVQAGYHITEIKAGSFQTLDCGGNPDSWTETILQVEDIAQEGAKAQMTAGKFASILAQVDRRVRLNHDARLTIEIGKPGEPMAVYDMADVRIEADRATLVLGIRAAICKPRHRAAQVEATSCCSSSGTKVSCC